MEIISRKEAMERGLKYYFTGKPCKHGHIFKRRVITGYCEKCNSIKYSKNRSDEDYLKKERERSRNWKRANKDTINARRRVRDKEWYVPPTPGPRQLAKDAGERIYFTGKPCVNGHLDYRIVSCGSCVVCKKEYAKTEEVKRINREKAKERRIKFPHLEREKSKRWAQKNKFNLVARSQRRRCKKLNATPPWVNHGNILAIFKEREEKNRNERVVYHVDHIVPLQGENVCGLHVPWNLQIITAKENQRKGNNLPPEEQLRFRGEI